MATNDIQNLLKSGVAAAKAGNKQSARLILEQVLELDDNSETAWMWYAMVVETVREKRICLENVLEINPNNQRAREALLRLEPPPSSSSVKPPPPPAAPLPPPRPQSSSDSSFVPRHAAPNVPVRRRSRILTLPFIVAGALAIGLIVLGVYLLLNPSILQPTPPPNGTPIETSIAAVPAVAGQITPSVVQPTLTAGPTLTPFGIVETLDPTRATDLPTITPSPSFTPNTPLPPTETLPPPNTYAFLFVRETKNVQPRNIYSIKGDGTGQQSILGNGAAPVFDIALASDRRIAYITWVDDKPQLFVAGPDGQNGKQITEMKGDNVSSPTWSPNGTQIAFASNDTGNNEIYIVNADGSGLTTLTDNKANNRDPAWSPVGNQIAFASDMNGANSLQIFVVILGDKNPRQISTSTGDNYSPAWSPTGSTLAFVSTRDRYENVYIMNGNGQNPHMLTYGNGSAVSRNPMWSPDGRYIAFSSNRGNNVFNLYLTTPDGKAVIPLTKNTDAAINSYSPRFLPGN
ncbi:MAG: hypothetical protein ABI947_25885 [Chloroflexota bacterium]